MCTAHSFSYIYKFWLSYFYVPLYRVLASRLLYSDVVREVRVS
jgi:hypothetical protein